MRLDIFGYFDRPEQTTPSHDPGMSAPCPVCAKPLSRPVVTTSLMPESRSDARCYFFRAHKACWDGISAAEQSDIESSLIDEIA